MDENLAKSMVSAQASREQRLALNKELPTDVIENNSEIFNIERKTQDLYQKLVNL
jgi:dephospho-CoA kinase